MVNNKYGNLLLYLHSIEEWPSENAFLIDVLSIGSIKFINKCNFELSGDMILSIPPLLPQVHENIVKLLGLIDNVYSLEDFINKAKKPSEIMDSVAKNNPQINEDKWWLGDTYIHGLKGILNDFCHSNFEGSMMLFTDRFQIDESIRFNVTMMKLLISLVEVPLVAILNAYYKQKISLPDPKQVLSDIEAIGTLRYLPDKFPEKIIEFIKSSPIINGYYRNAINKAKKHIKEFKQITK